ncbi:MAG: hypothetical protein AB3N10_18145 [Allomuricauda sp.]
MKNIKLLLMLLGVMLFSVSCEVESYEESTLEATNAKTSKKSNGDGCETGFAICAANLSNCFIDDGFNRWGWTIGPMSTSEHLFRMFTGAGQCDTSKGKLAVGVSIDYDSETGVAVVEYNAKEGYALKETHLYIGNDPYPMQQRGKKLVPTVAPGQYPYKHGGLDGALTDTYTIEGLSGEIYMIAHAVVCKDGN